MAARRNALTLRGALLEWGELPLTVADDGVTSPTSWPPWKAPVTQEAWARIRTRLANGQLELWGLRDPVSINSKPERAPPALCAAMLFDIERQIASVGDLRFHGARICVANSDDDRVPGAAETTTRVEARSGGNTSYEKLDAPYVEEGVRMVRSGEFKSAHAVAGMMALKLKEDHPSHYGSSAQLESITRRLAVRIRSVMRSFPTK